MQSTEQYSIRIYNGAAVVRTITVSAAQTVNYTTAQQTTDFGAAQTTLKWSAAQVSSVVGAGYEAVVTQAIV